MLIVVSIRVSGQKLSYQVDVSDLDSYFKVTVNVDGKLSDKNKIYQFASTVPGTYQVMDIGRYVNDFRALDVKGNEIQVIKISTNQYELTKPKKVKTILYEVAETWDTPVEYHTIYKMCGTSLEKDHALINPHCLIGFLSGMQASPINLSIMYPRDWIVATALNKNDKGWFVAESFDHLIDSPFLLGRLSHVSRQMNQTKIEIFTYSKTDLINSESLMSSMVKMLEAAHEFLVDFPVDRYTFLYHFEDEIWGAWEHSFSSAYVFVEQPLTEEYVNTITTAATHEFFHIITPLNIHSDIVEQFNFESPIPSEHLWLYEGVTEWAAHMIQLRGGIYGLEQYLMQQQQKLINNEMFNQNYSLSELALKSYTEEGQVQYPNIYSKGAIIASLLDIRLLELSNGQRGLREVIIDLTREYGQHKAFFEDEFFNVFIDMTYPEIESFINNYIKGTRSLPIREYYEKLGVGYVEQSKTSEAVAELGYSVALKGGELVIVNLNNKTKSTGLNDWDKLVAINENKVNLENANEIIGAIIQLPFESEYNITVEKSDGQVITKKLILSGDTKAVRHEFEILSNPSEQQLKFRNVWMKNLPY
ncbi:Predicted metalloprotease, contains C-terminal PDZ domain [Reichenbachiella faecimaris]|uniref:Predicted metalloprotease, contains C-terminal PDZ domain n=2 Tax=Reichenbachiella faecimaris TaxID=692418 RepID=A0A1W2GH98_REIFA|nr:Predicted metalloprotease, contains C-terminal PDZ domain [Reichenbachiella faecimaris]